MSLKINFYLESRQGNEKNLPINLLVWFDGLRLKYYTGFRIDGCKREGCEHKKCKTKWNYEDQEVKPNNLNEDGLTASFINKKLNKLKSDAASIYNEYENSKKPLTVEVFRNELKIRNDKLLKKAEKQGVNYYFELYKSLKSISPGRLKQVDVTFRHFTRFLVNDRDINSITHETISLFENYLKESDNKGHNTISSNLQRLRAFFMFAEQKDWIKTNPFKKYKVEGERYGRPIALTKNELELLYTKDLTGIPLYDQIRDLFVFQCCIGCRVSDLMRLTKANIINGFIQYVPTKTKDENPAPVSIPINDKARAILDKYSDSDTLLPFLSDVKYNLYLKDLFSHCKLKRQVIRLNPLTGIEESVSLAKIASSHLARRTFISILHKKVKDSVIASMTGHVKTSKAFARYYDIEDEQKTEVINLI
jgi:site-specific recombinase XerD